MELKELRKKVLEECRQKNWAKLESGLSQAVPKIHNKKIELLFFLYTSIVKLPKQQLYEPFAVISVNYKNGDILMKFPDFLIHEQFKIATPPKLLGEYPSDEAAKFPHEKWEKLWDELFDLYPRIIEAYRIKNNSFNTSRFRELFAFLTPAFMKPYYQSLNPDFFDWLGQNKTDSTAQSLIENIKDLESERDIPYMMNLTKQENVVNLTQNRVNDLSDEQFMTYSATSAQAGNVYMFNGKIKGFNPQANPIIYGTTTKKLVNRDGSWEIWQGGGLMPEFDLKPLMLNRSQFILKMKELGVSEEKLEEFFNFKPDYSNF